MTEAQKKVATFIGVGALAAHAALMIAFVAAAFLDVLKATMPAGAMFSGLADTFGATKEALKVFGVVVVAGAGYLGAKCVSSRTLFVVALFLLAGALADFSILFMLGDNDFTRNIHELTDRFENNEKFLSGARDFLTWSGGALVAGLVAFLGFSNENKKPDA